MTKLRSVKYSHGEEKHPTYNKGKEDELDWSLLA
jgi:hypothetical protein